MWNTLRRDPIVWVGAAVAVPYLVPLLSEAQMESYADLYSDTHLILVAIAAFQFRLRRRVSLSSLYPLLPWSARSR